jgi:hypothetical protein
MWSLPDIHRLNEEAVNQHRRRKGRAPSPRGKKCEVCGARATEIQPYYDVFGDPDVPNAYSGELDQ